MMYEAEDGQQFRTEPQCLEYEQQCANTGAANDMLDNGATLMATLTRAHQPRPWWDSSVTAEDKAILMNTTKDTGFVVRHWQCSDKPSYKPFRLNHAGKVMLGGDPGIGSGAYAEWVGLNDLLRYDRKTADIAKADGKA